MATDQEIRDAGFKYIPQQKYLQNPFELPTAPEAPVVNQGIVNTNAFTGGGNNNIGGNLFGYGTAVSPGDKSVITSGPYAGQSGYYNSPNYRGGLPGNIQQKGPGRFFDYGQKNEAGESVFYKDETLQPKKELPSWMKAAMAFAPGGTFLANRIENKMNPGYIGITQQQIDENYGGGGGSYGIAGLSDTQKQYYDALASQGFLYDGPGGMKTLDGKNFSRVDEDTINKYFQGIKDKGFATIEEYENYLNQDPKKRKNLKLILSQYKTLKGINDFNYGKQAKDIQDDIAAAAAAKDKDAALAAIKKQGAAGYNPGIHGATNYGTDSQGNQSFSGESIGAPGQGFGIGSGGGPVSNRTGRGRTGFRYGGLASLL